MTDNGRKMFNIILALLVSIAAWFFVVYNYDPMTSVRYSGVPITYMLETADGFYTTTEETLSLNKQSGKISKTEKYLDFTEQDINNMYTNIGRGLEKGIELFENQDENRRRIVIVLSDGINDGKGTTPYSYQQEADALTEQQTQILRDKNIELYCVAIDGGGQTDEDYLRQMVNYFDITNTYDKERCFWVK